MTDYKKVDGEYRLYHKTESNGDQLWFLWDIDGSGIWPNYSDCGIVAKKMAQPDAWGNQWFAYPFDRDSDPMNPTWAWGDNDWRHLNPLDEGILADEYELPAWPPANVNYPTTGDPASLLLADVEDEIDAEVETPAVDVEYFLGGVKTLQDKYVGNGVTIALLDTGVDADTIGIELVDSGDLGGVDVIGHGTRVASVIKSGESLGVAPAADIMSLKVFDDEGETSSEAVAEAIRYAVDNDAEVILMPFSLMPINSLINEALDYALEADVMLIAAAGNMGTEISPDSLAGQEGVITVGSVDTDGSVSSWSNYGDELDLLAPWDVVTLPGAEGEAGTSYSAAFIAGVSALMFSENPEISVEDVIYQLKILIYGPEMGIEEGGYLGYGTFGIGQEEKDKEKASDGEQKAEDRIKGADIDEVVSKFMVQRRNKAEFTGQPMKIDIGVKGPGMDTLMPVSPFSPIMGDGSSEEFIKQEFMSNVELLWNEYVYSEDEKK